MNTNGRINYRLYVSEIKASQIHPRFIRKYRYRNGRPVSLMEKDGKLEYIHTVRDAGEFII